MKKTGIFYGSTTGTTAEMAQRLAKLLNVDVADIHNVAETRPSTLGDYELIVAGTSTWGSGELQEDWYDFIAGVRVLDLQGHKVAIFGCGDETMSDTFCSAMGILYHAFRQTGAELIGRYPADCYDFTGSEARIGDEMVGLALDQVNRPELTEKRLSEWVKSL